MQTTRRSPGSGPAAGRQRAGNPTSSLPHAATIDPSMRPDGLARARQSLQRDEVISVMQIVCCPNHRTRSSPSTNRLLC